MTERHTTAGTRSLRSAGAAPSFEAPTIVPPTALVLIRSRESGAWEDRTSDVEHVESHGTRTGVRFTRSDRVYEFAAERVLVLDAPVVVRMPPGARLRVRDKLWGRMDPEDVQVREFGRAPDAWRTVSYRTKQGDRHRSYPADEVEIVLGVEQHGRGREVMDYWRAIVASRADAAARGEKPDPIVWPFDHLQDVNPDSVLAAYLVGKAPVRRPAPESLVLPFSGNLSQREAIRTSLSSTLSVIEGPPGTGKTETILNLVAHIVSADLGTVGVVSFSNPAVDNVEEKLRDEGFGHLIAQLGNKPKLDAFLTAEPTRAAKLEEFLDGAPTGPPPPAQLAEIDHRLTRALAAQRQHAKLRDQLDSYHVEQRQFERHIDTHSLPDLSSLPLLRRSPERILEFLAETQLDQERGRPGLLRRIRRYLRYGPSSGLDPADADVVLALQAAFYARRIADLERQLAAVDRALAGEDLDGLAQRHRDLSTQALQAAVASRHRTVPPRPFDDLPRDEAGFAAFCRSHPVILSTCHSLLGRLPPNHLLDYLVIDEASQVNLLAASLAMACCRNLIVVGDRRQLPHIPGPVPADARPPLPAYDYELHSVLSSVTELYGHDLPVTQLREHYRSHPAIIGFCNAAFYDGELIPYTQADDRTEPAMWVHATVPGNHMRSPRAGGRFNQREIDVIEREVLNPAPDVLEVPDVIAVPATIEPSDIAVASPYRHQVDKAAAALGDAASTIDTVYGLQGRAKRVVILTTVLSESHAGRRGLRFVDDPRLVNVAVSRAIDHFVLVTNHAKLASSRHLRDLIGYIEYRYPDHQPAASRIVSVFDLLYREYDAVLRPLAARLSRGTGSSPAERIVDVVLADLLAEPGNGHLRTTPQMLLRNLVPAPNTLSDEQRAFVRHRSSVDFVVYNRVSRRPVLAIEVDGFRFHEDRPEQLRRDAIKDVVLDRVGIPLLRLPTMGSGEQQRIRDALANAERAR